MNRKRCHSVVAAASVRRGGRKTMRMQMLKYWWVGLAITLGLATGAQAKSQPHAERWTEKAANEWYAKHPWLVGSNYTPASAINELEMWQADTFDRPGIDKELSWAESIGLNTMRVFLHDLTWQQDPAGFKKRIDTFLQIAEKHHIKPLFVLFDSCWDPNPQLGKQREPRPGVHNSGWVQSPGAEALRDSSQYPRLEAYVKGIVGAFGRDKRILWLQPYRRPILCTEYMARGNGSTFQGSLPIAKKYHVAAINWGLVAGKTQTYLPWDSWQHPYTDREPAIWFHEIFRTNGIPYRQEEAEFIREIIGRK